MANTKISMSLPYACLIDNNLEAILIIGPIDIEYDNSIYQYVEGATPADAVQALIDINCIPSDNSISRIEQILLNSVNIGQQPSQELLDSISDVKAIMKAHALFGPSGLPEGFTLPEGVDLKTFLELCCNIIV